MLKEIRTFASIGVILFLAGCATTTVSLAKLSLAQLASSEGGPAPGAAEKTLIRASLGKELRDPPSAQFLFSPPNKVGLQWHGQTLVAWQVRVLVDASNSFDGHPGYQMFAFYFRDGQIIHRDGEMPIPGDRWLNGS